MEIVRNYFITKKINFYVGFSFALLMIFLGFFYAITYSAETAYYNPIVWIIALIGGFGFIGLSLTKHTLPFAPVILGLGGLGTFAAHIRYCYMYFTNIFFNGVTFKAILDMNITCTLTILIPLISLIVGICLMYLKQTKEGE